MPSSTRTPTHAHTISPLQPSRSNSVRKGAEWRATRAMRSKAPCPQLAQLEHIALATDDVEGLRDFYLLLGAVASPTGPGSGTELRSCVLDFCGVRLELFKRHDGGIRSADDGRPSALVHLGFALGSADALDALTDVLAAARYRVLEPPHRTGELGRYESIVLDPDRNRLKLTV